MVALSATKTNLSPVSFCPARVILSQRILPATVSSFGFPEPLSSKGR